MEDFEGYRGHLRAVAYRMLGSVSEADDAVQEARLRLARADQRDIGILGGWLTTVVARLCLDLLRARTLRREQPWDAQEPFIAGGPEPEDEALPADSVGLALLVVLDALIPAERVAFVLHDTFGVPFEQIGEITGAFGGRGQDAGLPRPPARARGHRTRTRSGPPAGDGRGVPRGVARGRHRRAAGRARSRCRRAGRESPRPRRRTGGQAGAAVLGRRPRRRRSRS